LKRQIGEVLEVEVFALFALRALDVELDLGDLTWRDVLEASGQRVQLDRTDRSDDAQTGIGPHAAMVSGLRAPAKLDAVQSARDENDGLVTKRSQIV
jgi:hypothetical protein